MFLETLSIKNVRNMEHVYIEPSPELNIILGENGAGKTNLIEAVYLLSGAKSFKKVKDEEILKFGEKECFIEGEVESEGIKNRLKIEISKEDLCQRKGFENGLSVGRAFNLAGNFCAVVFTPDNLSMIKRGKEYRRSFLDNAICNIYPSFITVLRRYNRLLQQKNALLKQHCYKEDLLDVLDEQLSVISEDISTHRIEYIDEINKISSAYYDGISNSGEVLKLRYEGEGHKKDDYVNLFLRRRDADIRYGFCGNGVHRDDMNIELSKKPARNFASQGQQRSIVLSLKKAEAEIYYKKTKRRPVLLFDDVLSELDENRQKFLLSDIQDCQTFFTACDRRAFFDLDVKIFSMGDGKIL